MTCPLVVSPEVVERIGRWIALGMTEEQACCKEGVNHSTFRTAKKRDEFSSAIKRAHADYMAGALTRIDAGMKGWQGAAWILERRHRPQFNRTDTHASIDERGAAIFTREDLDELAAMGRQLMREQPARDS